MRHVHTGMRRNLIVGLALSALLLGGCSSAGDNSAPTSAGGAGAAPEKAAPPAVDGLSRDADNKATGGTEATVGPTVRSLIYRGDITVRVDDVEKAAEQVSAMATTLGGHVDSEKRNTGTQQASATIVIRVPSKEFSAAFDRVKALGKEQTRSSNVEDVTEAVVDLDTRIASKKAQLEATRRLYGQAPTFADVVNLGKEVQQQEADLAVLEAKKRRVDDLIALSTITVVLLGPNTDIPVEKKNPGFLDGLEAGWDAFLTSVRVLMVVTGWLLPFTLAIAIPVIVLVLLLRRRRKVPQSGDTSA